MWIIITLGIIAFLVMEHNTIFWLLFVPLGLLLLAAIVGFFKNPRSGLSGLFWILFILIVIIVALILVAS